ncbi:hypothetical protein [Neobacillus vireti]|uniref:hypothetical protein n=1 Tax=Neobacillus vireti TaxID=220686 RepID=UPI003000ED61
MSQIIWSNASPKPCIKRNSGNCIHKYDENKCQSTFKQHICKHMTGRLGRNEKWIHIDTVASNFDSQNELEQAFESESDFPTVENLYYKISTDIPLTPFAAGRGYKNNPKNITFLGRFPYRGVLVGGTEQRGNNIKIFTCFRPTYGNNDFNDFLAKCFLYIDRNINNITWIHPPKDIMNHSLSSYAATLERDFQTQNSEMQHFLLRATKNSKKGIYEFFIWLYKQVENFYILKNSLPTNENIYMFITATELLVNLRNNIISGKSLEENHYEQYICNSMLEKINGFENNVKNYLNDKKLLSEFKSHLQDIKKKIQENINNTNDKPLDKGEDFYLNFLDFEINLFNCILSEKNPNKKLSNANWEEILQSLFT